MDIREILKFSEQINLGDLSIINIRSQTDNKALEVLGNADAKPTDAPNNRTDGTLMEPGTPIKTHSDRREI